MRKADGTLSLSGRDSEGQGQETGRLMRSLLGALNIFIIMVGFLFLTAGSYASVEGIIDEFRLGTVGSVFTCASNGL